LALLENNHVGMKKKTLALAALTALSLASASAQILEYQAVLTGPNESPPNASPGTGFADVLYDQGLHTLSLNVTFSGLTGPTTASHIHAATATPGSGTAGVATTTPYFTGFPIGVTAGTYVNTLDLTLSSSWNASYVTANGGTTASAEAALAAALAADKAYLNIHSQTFPGGEIRGFLVLVPEPTPWAFAGLVAAALACRARRARQATPRLSYSIVR
jgi:hypothetical protein